MMIPLLEMLVDPAQIECTEDLMKLISKLLLWRLQF